MATVLALNDSLNAVQSSSLVLPPSGTNAATETTAPTDATGTTAATTATTTSPLAGITSQPLSVVLNALASAGVDTDINAAIVTPPADQATGSFSLFMGELLSTLAAQSAQQTAQRSAAQPANSTSVFENDAQSLAQTVNSPSGNTIATNTDNSINSSALAPLQQSFDQFVAGTGGTTGSASLGSFLTALANNLHTAQSPLGNIVNAQA